MKWEQHFPQIQQESAELWAEETCHSGAASLAYFHFHDNPAEISPSKTNHVNHGCGRARGNVIYSERLEKSARLTYFTLKWAE